MQDLTSEKQREKIVEMLETQIGSVRLHAAHWAKRDAAGFAGLLHDFAETLAETKAVFEKPYVVSPAPVQAERNEQLVADMLAEKAVLEKWREDWNARDRLNYSAICMALETMQTPDEAARQRTNLEVALNNERQRADKLLEMWNDGNDTTRAAFDRCLRDHFETQNKADELAEENGHLKQQVASLEEKLETFNGQTLELVGYTTEDQLNDNDLIVWKEWSSCEWIDKRLTSIYRLVSKPAEATVEEPSNGNTCDACIDLLTALGFDYKEARLKDVLTEIGRLKNQPKTIGLINNKMTTQGAKIISDIINDDDFQPIIPDSFKLKMDGFVQRHFGVNEFSQQPLWHTKTDGLLWCGHWYHRTPAQLERECLSTLAALRAAYEDEVKP